MDRPDIIIIHYVATGRLPTFHGRLKVMTEIDNYHINFILVPESVHFSLLLMVKNGLELSYVENLQNLNQSVEMRMRSLKYRCPIFGSTFAIPDNNFLVKAFSKI